MNSIHDLMDEYQRLIKPSLLYPDKNEFVRNLEPFSITHLYEILNTLIEQEEYDYCSLVQKRIDTLENKKYR